MCDNSTVSIYEYTRVHWAAKLTNYFLVAIRGILLATRKTEVSTSVI